MTVGQLQQRYVEVFGEPVRSRHKQYLIHRIAWRLQANAEGGLSERALRRAEEPANVADARITPPRAATQATNAASPPASATDHRPSPAGTALTRPWLGGSTARGRRNAQLRTDQRGSSLREGPQGSRLDRWRAVLVDERENAAAVLPIGQADMRLDRYFGGDHAFSHMTWMLRAKLGTIDQVIATVRPRIARRFRPQRRDFFSLGEAVAARYCPVHATLLKSSARQATLPAPKVFRPRMGVRVVRHFAWTVLLGTLTTAAADLRAVQFIALVPDRAADQSPRVYLACSADNWNERGRPLERVAPGLYSATIDVPPGRLEYKFTREGRWATVEKSAAGQEIANRVLMIEPDVAEWVVVHSIAAWADRPPAEDRRVEFVGTLDGTPANSPTTRPTSGPATRPASTLRGNVRVHHDFASRQLGSTRTLLVWLPPGYDQTPDARYPVLYLHDGQNVFDAATSFAGTEWQADETATRLIAAGKLRPLIMVGIYNTADRINEYTPFRDERHGGGRGDAYLDFLIETVKPFIDRTYRTQPGPASTAVTGSSLGGLISLYVAFRRSDVFGAAGGLSPTLFWADRAMLRYTRENPPTPRPKLWIDIGTGEGRGSAGPEVTEHVVACRDLVEILEQQGYRRDADLHYEEISGGQHHERDWATRFDRVLLFLADGEKQQP